MFEEPGDTRRASAGFSSLSTNCAYYSPRPPRAWPIPPPMERGICPSRMARWYGVSRAGSASRPTDSICSRRVLPSTLQRTRGAAQALMSS
jgi:hypothetical protein